MHTYWTRAPPFHTQPTATTQHDLNTDPTTVTNGLDDCNTIVKGKGGGLVGQAGLTFVARSTISQPPRLYDSTAVAEHAVH
jgi:ribosomal protein S9